MNELQEGKAYRCSGMYGGAAEVKILEIHENSIKFERTNKSISTADKQDFDRLKCEEIKWLR